jgi:hypothetical protein
MSSSLLNERPLVISPTLAATIGLEEAVMLQLLHDFARFSPQAGHAAWREIDARQLRDLLPFWDAHDCERVAGNLRDKGVLAIDADALERSGMLRFSLDAAANPAAARSREPAQMPGGKTPIASRWQPDAELLRHLALHGISREFADAQRDEFMIYWTERGEPAHSWNAKFRTHVIRRWREHEATAGVKEVLPQRIAAEWQPDIDALEILQRAGVSRHFIEDAVPEFVLYWTERGEAARTWNSRFVSHVKRQWARYTQTMELDADPRLLAPDWQPKQDVFDILQMANIDAAFARALLPEFVLYWTERGEAYPSWNSKFLQYVKYHWARSHGAGGSTEPLYANRQGTGGKRSTRARSLVEDLTDRSWAD